MMLEAPADDLMPLEGADGHSVYHLQSMLRTISFLHSSIPRLIPNGTFGAPTQEAVMAFQRAFDLPVSGVVDNDTWDAVVAAYTNAFLRMEPPLAVSNLASWRDTISPGERSVYFLLVQAIFAALSTVLDEVAPCGADGRNGGLCAQNVRWLQRIGGLRQTGILGKEEWDLLTRIYTVFLLRAER